MNIVAKPATLVHVEHGYAGILVAKYFRYREVFPDLVVSSCRADVFFPMLWLGPTWILSHTHSHWHPLKLLLSTLDVRPSEWWRAVLNGNDGLNNRSVPSTLWKLSPGEISSAQWATSSGTRAGVCKTQTSFTRSFSSVSRSLRAPHNLKPSLNLKRCLLALPVECLSPLNSRTANLSG